MEYCEYCYDEIKGSKWNLLLYDSKIDINDLIPYLKRIKIEYDTVRFRLLNNFWRYNDNITKLKYSCTTMHPNCAFTLMYDIEQNCIYNKINYITNIVRKELEIEFLVNYDLD